MAQRYHNCQSLSNRCSTDLTHEWRTINDHPEDPAGPEPHRTASSAPLTETTTAVPDVSDCNIKYKIRGCRILNSQQRPLEAFHHDTSQHWRHRDRERVETEATIVENLAPLRIALARV